MKTEASVDGGLVQLEVLLSNLVDNALRYTPTGGVVDVIVDTMDGAPVLRVIDNGPGLPIDERSRVFDRFYRGPLAPDSPPGSGLGLAIVRAIADRHGAVVSLQDWRFESRSRRRADVCEHTSASGLRRGSPTGSHRTRSRQSAHRICAPVRQDCL